MTSFLTAPNLAFEAEIVEVFERDGRRLAKVLVPSFFLEIDAADLATAHLGDRVLLQTHAPAGRLLAADQEAK